MTTKIVLPSRGEFGLKIRYHVPAVHAIEADRKIVYAEPGEEALYPSADEVVEVPRLADDLRAGTHPRKDRDFAKKLRARIEREVPVGVEYRIVETRRGMVESRFMPEPKEKAGIPPPRFVVCPRGRRYGSAKNWPHWEELVDLLLYRGSVFAAGAPDSSLDIQVARAWDFRRFLDASIEAIRGANVVVATDAGLAHLAVLCGRPLLLITADGLVAPGPVVDPSGRVLQPRYWPIRLEEYYDRANWLGSPIVSVSAWDSPDLVAELAEELALNVDEHLRRRLE